uniref:Ig-like domain-containing protein n=1 Tax=Sander lucioperca TaxID=283035 RepID=A0A8C9ZY05_SANLU
PGEPECKLYFGLYFLHTGQCQDVTQHPEISWRYVSQSAEMNCSHNKDISHTQMYWFRQRPGETMTLVVYTVVGGQPDYGGVPQTKYSAIKENTESGALTVKDLQLEDSAVYFCNTVTYTEPAYFGKGTKLTVLGKHFNGPRKKTIVCVASGFYPDHVSVKWKIDDGQTLLRSSNHQEQSLWSLCGLFGVEASGLSHTDFSLPLTSLDINMGKNE